MNASLVTSLISSQIALFGLSALTILGSVIGIAVALLVFHFGWTRLTTDKSLKINGFYVRSVPFARYHRFRSKAWNIEHMA